MAESPEAQLRDKGPGVSGRKAELQTWFLGAGVASAGIETPSTAHTFSQDNHLNKTSEEGVLPASSRAAPKPTSVCTRKGTPQENSKRVSLANLDLLLGPCVKSELELELIQPQMAQKPVLRDIVGARALRVRSVSREEVWGECGCARRLGEWVWV